MKMLHVVCIQCFVGFLLVVQEIVSIYLNSTERAGLTDTGENVFPVR